jgi:hypothetical protein
MLYKCLDRGFFRIPEAAPGASSVAIDAAEMAAILDGVQLPVSKAMPREIARRARNCALHQAAISASEPGA